MYGVRHEIAVTSVSFWGKTDLVYLRCLEVSRLGFIKLLACSITGCNGTVDVSLPLCKLASHSLHDMYKS